ncbi:Uncharacterised protein [Candidatus Bilamarchaeum dharawalense]|uniref:Uncharacterized protein n=1 Tax=Candidatus Bilamarchaeum dharawalense TaxID=2885759 RepID=A0A5E4LPG4_9ARCH|nr:Uncharacterised protein [Candidatus Bilamarchaeum dharawalense]
MASATEYAHPLFATSFANANENQTLYRFRIFNNESTPTLPFRLWLTSDMNWFDPDIFSYALPPDGADDDSPYWDFPPVYPNESAEISFRVNRTVGLPDRILLDTEALNKWIGECKTFVPLNGTNESETKIENYLWSLNKSYDVVMYYEENGYALAKIKDYNTFAVFKIGNITEMAMIEDDKTITTLVSNYVKKGTVDRYVNLSQVRWSLEETQRIKSRPEKDCYRISGMDRFPCVDRDTCLYACFSVPVCSNIGQSGWSFLDTLQSYNKTVYDANTKLDHAVSSSADLELSPNYERAAALLQELIELNRAETKVIYHPLYTSYGYCEPADYAIPQQMGARRDLLDYLEINCLYGQKDWIIQESIHTAVTLNPPKPKPKLNNTINVTPQVNTSNHIELQNITTNQTETQEECCLGGMCSLGGVKKIAGLCWQWGAIILVVAVLAIYWLIKPKRR